LKQHVIVTPASASSIAMVITSNQMRLLDSDIAGCVTTFIKKQKLDLSHTAILGLCYRDCTVVVRGLDGDAKEYFHRLEKLAKLVLESARDAAF
jgi:hypothetical protein